MKDCNYDVFINGFENNDQAFKKQLSNLNIYILSSAQLDFDYALKNFIIPVYISHWTLWKGKKTIRVETIQVKEFESYLKNQNSVFWTLFDFKRIYENNEYLDWGFCSEYRFFFQK